MSQNPNFLKTSGLFIALLCAGFLLSAAPRVHAQSYPTIVGTYPMTEVADLSSVISGAPYNVTSSNTFNVTIVQSNNTFTLISPSLAGPLVGTLSGNTITSLTGPALIMNQGFTATTNAITSGSGMVYSNQILIQPFTASASGVYAGGSVFQTSAQGYMQIVGLFAPLQAPTIITQPVSVTNILGSTVSFSVVATGATNLSYQWIKGTPNGAAAILNATGSTYTINSIQASDAAIYTVQISNLVGSTNSARAGLYINYPPYITVQPAKLLNVPIGTKPSSRSNRAERARLTSSGT